MQSQSQSETLKVSNIQNEGSFYYTLKIFLPYQIFNNFQIQLYPKSQLITIDAMTITEVNEQMDKNNFTIRKFIRRNDIIESLPIKWSQFENRQIMASYEAPFLILYLPKRQLNESVTYKGGISIELKGDVR